MLNTLRLIKWHYLEKFQKSWMSLLITHHFLVRVINLPILTLPSKTWSSTPSFSIPTKCYATNDFLLSAKPCRSRKPSFSIPTWILCNQGICPRACSHTTYLAIKEFLLRYTLQSACTWRSFIFILILSQAPHWIRHSLGHHSPTFMPHFPWWGGRGVLPLSDGCLDIRKLELFNKALEMEICQRERKLVKENGRENVARRWQQVTKQSWTALPGKESPKVRGW